MQDPSQPGERRLTRPPSERYRTPAPDAADAQTGGRAGSGAVLGAAALAALTALAIVVAGGAFEITAGLIALAGLGGWGVATVLRRIPAGRRRTGLAIALALGGVALAQVGLWAYADWEGGVLGPLDYLAQVFGALVPLQLAAAAAAAWVAAR